MSSFFPTRVHCVTIWCLLDCRPTSSRTCRRRRATGRPAPPRLATTPTRRRKRKKTSTTTTTSPSQMVRRSWRQWKCENAILGKKKKKTTLFILPRVCSFTLPPSVESLLVDTLFSLSSLLCVCCCFVLFFSCDLCPHSRCPHSVHCLIWPGR